MDLTNSIEEETVCFPGPIKIPEPYVREHWSRDCRMTEEEEISWFANYIEDTNPLHHDDAAARKKRVRKTNLLGRITTGVRIITYVSPTVAENFPAGMVVEIENIRFVSPLYAGSFPTVDCTVIKKTRKLTRVAVVVRNGFKVITTATCVIAHEG